MAEEVDLSKLFGIDDKQFIQLALMMRDELAGHPEDDEPEPPWGLSKETADILDDVLSFALSEIWKCDNCGEPAVSEYSEHKGGKIVREGSVCMSCMKGMMKE